MVGAEMPMSSDQIVWSEQTRLHIAYETCAIAGASHKDKIDITVPSGKD